MPVWRRDESERRSYVLTITRAGREAINVTPDEEPRGPVDDAPQVVRPTAKASSAATAGPRAGSKLALVVGMLCEPDGTTIDALVSATGWLPHTTRAAPTGRRKRGYRVERECSEERKTFYRIVAESDRDAA